MSRCRLPLIAALISLAFASHTARADGLVRIEPRPYYGAVVSIEQGVRVFRPLPTQHLMIINPGNKTPINLSFNRTIEHKAADAGGGGSSGSGAVSGYDGGHYAVGGFGGNAIYGTNPRVNRRTQAGGVGIGPVQKLHMRKPPHH